MNAMTSVTVLGMTSALLVFGCQTKPDYDAAGGRGDDPSRATAKDIVIPPGPSGATPHHDERPGIAAPVNTGATGTVTGALRAGENTGKDHDAEAKFQSVPTMKIEGDAELEEVEGGVRIQIEVEHALPGQKGIHIHQTDNCSDIANKSMGEHFAPTTAQHGLPGAPQHHLGDLGNIDIDKDGNGKLDITVAGANLKPNDPLSFIGKSIVIHESNDKGTGASGDSGKPIACAPIKTD